MDGINPNRIVAHMTYKLLAKAGVLCVSNNLTNIIMAFISFVLLLSQLF